VIVIVAVLVLGSVPCVVAHEHEHGYDHAYDHDHENDCVNAGARAELHPANHRGAMAE